MIRRLRFLAACLTVVGLVVAGGSVFAQPKDKQEKGAKPSHTKQHKSMSGKGLVGEKIKQNGNHKIHEHGKFAASVDVQNGKISGVKVKHAEKGDIPVTKYKTTKKMASGSRSGIYLASYAYAQDQYIGTLWIGYGYIDDWGDEYIYWFPYDMILDGATGAIDYYPAY